MVEDDVGIRSVAHAFVAAAFAALRDVHVIPTPVFHPYVKVGRDYFGDDVRVSEFRTLEVFLERTYPERFDATHKGLHREFASSYVFSLLEACVARCGQARNFDEIAPFVEQSVDEMVAVLEASSYEVVSCRLVAHMTTGSGTPVQIGDVTVVPKTEDPNWPMHDLLLQRIVDEIPGAASTFNREEPRPHDPPHALLITRTASEDPDAYGVADGLTARLERFLLLARLLTAGTFQSYYEVRGMPTLVSRIPADYLTFGKGTLGLLDRLIRRTVRLTGDETPAFEALGGLIDSADVKREGMAATSLDVALGRFNSSHVPGNQFEHLVDLATALEAILAGGEKDNEALTFRLRSRAAALLATDDDPAKAIFNDVGHLYGLRSTIVHGGQMKQTDLRKIVGKISIVPPQTAETKFGIASGYAVDRMRDIVRRALLARLCLGAEPDPLWPFAGSTAVDSLLSDDATRARWRARWHERMADLGAADAAGPPRAAVDFLSQEDR